MLYYPNARIKGGSDGILAMGWGSGYDSRNMALNPRDLSYHCSTVNFTYLVSVSCTIIEDRNLSLTCHTAT